MNTGISVALIKASEITQWIKMFGEHTRDCFTTESVKLKALAYEQKLRSAFPDKQAIEAVIDTEFIKNYKANPGLHKHYLSTIILSFDLVSNEFPLLGSMVDEYEKALEAVILLCRN